jgi:hypothetical protein
MLVTTLRSGTSSLFADGSGGAMWFAGLGTEPWINNKGLSAAEYAANGHRLLADPVGVLRLAVRNFHRHFLWVGVLEEFESSLALLGLQTSLTFPAEAYTRRENSYKNNNNTHAHSGEGGAGSEAEKRALQRAYPVDQAFYAYVSAVQRARLQYVVSQTVNGDSTLTSTARTTVISRGRGVRYCESRDEWEQSLGFRFSYNGSLIWPVSAVTADT